MVFEPRSWWCGCVKVKWFRVVENPMDLRHYHCLFASISDRISILWRWLEGRYKKSWSHTWCSSSLRPWVQTPVPPEINGTLDVSIPTLPGAGCWLQGKPVPVKWSWFLLTLSFQVVDHYENPRNVGSLDKTSKNVGTGLVGAPACGDVMKLQVPSGSRVTVITSIPLLTECFILAKHWHRRHSTWAPSLLLWAGMSLL
jgi:hypothetical protein